MLARKKILLAKIEGTYGTDPTPTGAANAMLTSNMSIRPLEGSTVNRNLDRPILGNDEAIHVGTHVAVEFDVEIAGAGAAGTAPAYGPLLKACGMAETINAGVSVVYDPVSTSFSSVTIYCHYDGGLHEMNGCRGTVSLRINPLGIPVYHFMFTGLYVAPTAVADPTPDWSAFTQPIAVDNTNTPTFTLHGSSYNLIDFSLDMANQVVYRNVVGTESVQIVDRAPAGSVTIEEPDLGTKNWYTTVKANTTGAVQLVHGTTAGNIVQIDGTTVQLLSPTKGETDGISTLQMNLAFIPSDSGDDEVSITVK